MENLKCLCSKFPWDIFLFCLLLGLLLWALLWWLLNRRIQKFKAQIDELKDRNVYLEGELDACRKNKVGGTASVDIDGLNAKIGKLEADLNDCNKAKLAALAAGAVGGAVVGNVGVTSPVASLADNVQAKDDLKVVEGIGPKIEGICHEAGIYTFNDLANTSIDRLREILNEAGPRYQMHDPSTWPKQAELARDGQWDQLKAWQDELDKGRV